MRVPALQRLFSLRVLAVLVFAAWTPLPAAAQDAAPNEAPEAAENAVRSPLAITELQLEPEPLTADTLCRLAVTLRNDGDRPVSGLRFVVKVNEQTVPVYLNQVFLDVVPPGELVIVQLYNFWVTETGRPLPVDGELKVEVGLTEARWTKMEMEPAEAPKGLDAANVETETIETWTLLEPLSSLPDSVSVTRKLAKS